MEDNHAFGHWPHAHEADGQRRPARAGRWAWSLLVRNRLAIAVGSLLWLVFRSGPQPRRLAYPCQQAAAANVTAILVGLLPVALLGRRSRCPHASTSRVILGRPVWAAVVLCVAGFLAIEGYQYANPLETGAPPGVPPPPVEPPPATVAIYRQTRQASRYTAAEIDAMVDQAVGLAGGLDPVMLDRNSDGRIDVVVKPNLVNDMSITTYPENGVVTDPRVVAAVVRLAKQAGAGKGLPTTVTIAEGTAGPFDWNNGYMGRDITKYAFRSCGYTNDPATGPQWFSLDPDGDVALVDLNNAGGLDPNPPQNCTLVSINNAVMRRQLWVPNVLVNCDVLISVPTFKNHGNADVTLALKNRVGCAPSDIYHSIRLGSHNQQMKHALHFATDGFPWNVNRQSGYDYPAETTTENLIVNYMLVDQNLVRPQDFAVVDGLVGITNGPTGTSKVQPNMQMIMAGRDSVAVDTVGTLAMGYNPQYVRYLRWAYNRELGTMDTARITVEGNHVNQVRQLFTTNHPPTGSDLRVETSAPWISGISLVEGQHVSGEVSVTGSAFGDDRGVVRAELFVDGARQDAMPYPSNPFTFVWDTTDVTSGTHEVKLTVYDAALNEGSIVRHVAVNDPYAPADLNRDGDVDLEDYGRFQICLNGANIRPPLPGCEWADFDADLDVDGDDSSLFSRCLSGANVPAAPDCMTASE